MKINAINTYNYNQQKNISKDKINLTNNSLNVKGLDLNSYPVNYYITSFGAKNPYLYGSNNYLFQKAPRNIEKEIHNQKLERLNMTKSISQRYVQLSYIATLSENNEMHSDFIEFLSTNAKYSKFITNSQTDLFDKKLDDLRAVLCAFLDKYPQHFEKFFSDINKKQKELCANTTIAHSVFLSETVQDIKRNAKSFVEKVCLLRNAPKEMPNVFEMLNKIGIYANPLILKTDSSNKDFTKLLIKNTTYEEMKVLNGSNQTKEYNELFPEGLKNKMRDLKKQPAYLNLENSMYQAILQELINNKLIDENDILNLLKENGSIDKKLKKLLDENSDFYQRNLINFNNNYNKNKVLKVSAQENAKIKNILFSYNSELSEDDEDKLDVFLVQQGTYLKNVLKNDAISKFTIAKCWQDFDNFYGTNYAEAVNKKMQHSKILNECISFLDQLDGLLVDD